MGSAIEGSQASCREPKILGAQALCSYRLLPVLKASSNFKSSLLPGKTPTSYMHSLYNAISCGYLSKWHNSPRMIWAFSGHSGEHLIRI